MGLEDREGGVCVDAVALHEDALRLLDDRAPAERALQVLEFGVAAQRDLDRASELRRIGSIDDDVREHAAFRGLFHVRRIGDVEKRDHGTRRFVDDGGDLVERVLAVEADSHERDLCPRAAAEHPDIGDLNAARNDFVTEPFDDRGDRLESLVALVGDQNLQPMLGLRHARAPPVLGIPRREV